jgi:Flp pilus assembly protein TadD
MLKVVLSDIDCLHNSRSVGYSAGGNNPKAVAREILRHEPDPATLGQYGKAEHCCRKALQLRVDYAEAYHNLGSALGFFGRIEEAQICFHETLRHSAREPIAYNNLGAVVIRRRGKLAEASLAFARTAPVNPSL